ncbi:MAG: Fe2+-dependent dioxygenase [Pacificimonas sp.]
MILSISLIDENDALAAIQRKLGKLEWRDGKATAGVTARSVKANEQAVISTGTGKALSADILTHLKDNVVLDAAARPRRFSPPMISRTRDGGHYGPHVDNALMRVGDERLRTDLSYTLFLSAADSYDGGELVIHDAGDARRLKGRAGELVLYPSGSVHEVTQVTRGERLVCVGWIESLIADAAQRALLFDLENLRATLRQSHSRQSAELVTLDKSIANLMRMWARP